MNSRTLRHHTLRNHTLRHHRLGACGSIGAAGLAIALMLGVAGCSSGGSSSASTAGGSSAQSAVGGPVKGAPFAGDAGGSSGGTDEAKSPEPASASDALLQQRQLILDSSVSLSVADVLGTAGKIRTIATAAGGYVADEQTNTDQGPNIDPAGPVAGDVEPATGSDSSDSSDSSDAPDAARSALILADSTLTLRVPGTKLQSVTDQVAGLGTVLSRGQTSKDVTQQSVDVTSRLATQRASVARIRTLLSHATRISDIVLIEGELATRESTLESLEAQLKSLDDSVQLATLTVSLSPPTAVPHHTRSAHGFGSGLRHGWSAFTTALVAGLTGLGAALPFLILAALVAVPAFTVIRRRRRRQVAASA